MENMEQIEMTEQPEQTAAPEAAQVPERREAPPRQAPRRRKKPAPGILGFVAAYFAQIGRDVRWYFDIRLWSPVLLVVLILCSCTGSKLGAAGAAREYDATIQNMEAKWKEEREVLEMMILENDSLDEVPEPTAAPVDPETVALATLADVVGAGRSNNVKTAIMWVAINRSENAIEGHGKSLMEEINMPMQWQGYDPEKTYTYSQETYRLAEGVLELRDSGGLRPLDGNMMWLVLNDNGSVTIRNKYQGKNMVEKTVK